MGRKQLYGYSKWQTDEIRLEDLDMATKEKPLGRNWMFSNTAQNNAIKTNYI